MILFVIFVTAAFLPFCRFLWNCFSWLPLARELLSVSETVGEKFFLVVLFPSLCSPTGENKRSDQMTIAHYDICTKRHDLLNHKLIIAHYFCVVNKINGFFVILPFFGENT